MMLTSAMPFQGRLQIALREVFPKPGVISYKGDGAGRKRRPAVTCSATSASDHADAVAFFRAMEMNDKERARRILTKSDVNPAVWPSLRDGTTILQYGVQRGHSDLVALLIEAGADPNQRGEDMSCPLHLSIPLDNKRMLRVLLDAGADPNLEDASGCLPIHRAVLRGDVHLVHLLAKYKCKVDRRWEGRTALHLAVILCIDPDAASSMVRQAGGTAGSTTASSTATTTNTPTADTSPRAATSGIRNMASSISSAYASSSQSSSVYSSSYASPGSSSAPASDASRNSVGNARGCGNAGIADSAASIKSVSWMDRIAVVEALLENGADPNALCEDGGPWDGSSCMHAAAAAAATAGAGASIQAGQQQQQVQAQVAELLRLLVLHGGRTDQPNWYGKSARQLASRDATASALLRRVEEERARGGEEGRCPRQRCVAGRWIAVGRRKGWLVLLARCWEVLGGGTTGRLRWQQAVAWRWGGVMGSRCRCPLQ
eukprot:jgi/Mesvir1/8647/Mv02591-RA.1